MLVLAVTLTGAEQLLLAQLTVWMVVNVTSVVLAVKDLGDASRVRTFVRENFDAHDDITETDRMIVYRSRRLALHRVIMAVLFLLIGVDVALGLFEILDVGVTAWLFMGAAVALMVDVAYESRYRRLMFAQRNLDLSK